MARRSLLVVTAVVALQVAPSSARTTPDWPAFGRDAQHSGIATTPGQRPLHIRWSTPVDLAPQYTGDTLYIHYGSPLVTRRNTVIVTVLDSRTLADPISGATVMQEVLAVLGPTPDDSVAYPLAVREWCINTAAVDPVTRSAFVNSEDGKLYRWDFDSGALVDQVAPTSGVGEAYTPTLVGPDGAVYAINNAVLFAVDQTP